MAHFFSFKAAGFVWVKNQKLLSAILLTAILLFAAFLRLYRIGDYMTFLGDEGRDVLVVYNILHGDLTLLGPTSSVGGFFLGPIYYYLMTPALFLSNYDPVGPAIMVALFGVATVFLVYLFTREFLGKTAGLVAALLYAISPLVIAYSRSSWNPNPLPFFSLLTLYLLYKGVVKNKWFFFVFAGISYGIMLQLHYVALFLGAVIILYVVLSRLLFFKTKKILPKTIEIIKDGVSLLVGTVIGFSPFLAFEARHGFPNLQHMFTFIFVGESGVSTGEPMQQTLWGLLFRLYARLLVAYPPVEQLSLNSNMTITLFPNPIVIPILIVNVFVLLLLVSTLILLFVAGFRSFKAHKNRHYFLLLVLWLFVGLSFFLVYKKNIHDYYFSFLFPIPFILTGFLLSLFYWDIRFKIGGRIVSGLILAILLIVNLNGIPFRSPANRQKDQVKLISDFVLKKAAGKPFNFALLTLGNSDHAYRYFFKLAGKDPVVIQTPEKDPKRTTITNQLLIVCEDPNCKPLGSPLWEVAGFGRGEIVDSWPVSVVTVYKLAHYKGEDTATPSAQ